MKYYILEFDYEYEYIMEEDIPQVFKGISLNFGVRYDNLPSIKLKIGGESRPNCIPSFGGHLYFDAKIRSILERFHFDKVQYMDVEVISDNYPIDKDEYKLVNILNTIPAIDRANSVLQIDEDEEDEDCNIRMIDSLQMDKDAIAGQLIFRMIGFETLLVVCEEIAQAIVNEHCTGFYFVNAEGYRV